MFLAVIAYTVGGIAHETPEIKGETRQELLGAARDKERMLGPHYRLSSIVYSSDGRSVTMWRDNRWHDAAREFLTDTDEPML